MALSEAAVETTEQFEDDLDQAIRYYLEQSGPRSATRLLDEYDSFRETVALFPKHGTRLGESQIRWRALGVFVAIYFEDEDEEKATLLRLYYLSPNWKTRILESPAE